MAGCDQPRSILSALSLIIVFLVESEIEFNRLIKWLMKLVVRINDYNFTT